MAILEVIKISINNNYLINYMNVYGEKTHDYISANDYSFNAGKIYGIICEQGAGGEGISQILTNKVSNVNTQIYIDGMETNNISDLAWYVGKTVKYGRIVNKELSIKKALELAVKKYNRYKDIETIIEEFHLSRHRINYGLSNIDVW